VAKYVARDKVLKATTKRAFMCCHASNATWV